MNQSDATKFTQLANFQDKQLAAWYKLLTPECKYLLYGGAAAGGKSYFMRWTAIGLGMYYYIKYGIKNVPIGLFSEDYPTLKDRQIIKMKTEIPPYIGRLVDSQDLGYIFQGAKEYGEFLVLLRNLDDPSKYASVEFAAIGVEELTKNTKTTFDDLRFRLRFPGIKDVKFFAATNPGSKGHGFVKKLWIKPDVSDLDKEQARFFFISAKYEDNKYIDEDYVNQLDSLPEDKRRAFKDGSWDVFEGQFFTEFNDNHICDPLVPRSNIPKVGGMDWGLSKPFCMLGAVLHTVYMQDGRTFNRLYVYKEYYGTEKTPEEWGSILNKHSSLTEQYRHDKKLPAGIELSEYLFIRGDPKMFHRKDDGSMSIANQMGKELGDDSYKLKPATNDRAAGWTSVKNWLKVAPDGIPYLLICRDCKNLIRTLPDLVYDENNKEDLDTDQEDHAADALRYMCVHVKWIDANVGGVEAGGAQRPKGVNPEFMSNMDLEKFVR